MARTTGGRRKVTFTLPTELVTAVQALVAEGEAPSQSAFVAEALSQRVKQAQEERLRVEFLRAGADPLFLRDVEETDRTFRSADGETARMIPD